MFRPVRQEGKAALSEWLGPSADADVRRLVHSRPPLHSDAIHQITLEEIDKGFCSPLRSMKEMDDLFGQGGWRAVERFLIIQPDGKQISYNGKSLHQVLSKRKVRPTNQNGKHSSQCWFLSVSNLCRRLAAKGH